MKKKENVYVVIDTPKKAKKVIKVLELFNEKVYEGTLQRFEQSAGLECFPTLLFANDMWQGDTCMSFSDREEVSIKELRNILALEHLKEGDVVVVDNNHGKWIVKLTGNDIVRFEHSASYDLDLSILNDKECIERQNKIYGGSFIRYATEEEKALLDDKPKEFEVGKWYWLDTKNVGLPLDGTPLVNCLYFFNGKKRTYGFNYLGEFADYLHGMDKCDTYNLIREATKEEVEQALIKEAKKRYKVGDKVRSLVAHSPEFNISEHKYMQFSEISDLWVRCGDVNALVFRDGKWAEIVEPSFVESADKIKIAGGNIGKRVRVIDGGHGAKGCDGKVGIIVDRSSVDFSNYGGACSTDRAECYIMTDEGYYWGLCEGYEIEYITESSPLTVALEIKDIDTLQVIQKTLKELEEKLTKLI